MMMMYEGKHIHYSPADKRPLCSYSGKLCRQRRINGFAFCIRHILEDKTAPFKQCAHVAKYNNQKCSNPIPANENREFCNSHMQVAGIVPKKERRIRKDKDFTAVLDGKLKFSERVKVLLKGELDVIGSPEHSDCLDVEDDDDPYAFPSEQDVLSDDNAVGWNQSSLSTKRMPPSKVHSDPSSTVGKVSKRVVVKIEPNGDDIDHNIYKPKTEDSGNCSGKNNVKKSSKSINRLEAKINHNRILDKLKKNRVNVPPSPPPFSKRLSPETTLESESQGDFEETNDHIFKSDPSYPYLFSPPGCHKPATSAEPFVRPPIQSSLDALETSVATMDPLPVPANAVEGSVDDYPCTRSSNKLIEILPNRRGWRWPWKRPELVPRCLQSYKRLWLEKRDLRADQFPLGLQISDSESSDSDSELYQRQWFCPPADATSWLAEGGTGSFRSARSSVEKTELRRRCRQMCRSQAVLAPERRTLTSLARTLSRAARSQPAGATKLVDVLSYATNVQPTKAEEEKKWTKNMALTKQKCCYKNEDCECSNTALPYTRHCVKHIMYNVDQLLFEHCTAKFADNTQCCIPIFDICHELPLCLEHARKMDNYGKLSTEPKPKKPRKKPKHSALTRPSKRGKKKKKLSGCCSRSDSDLSTSLLCQSSSISDVHQSSLHYGMSSDLSPSTSDLGGNASNELDGSMEPDLSADLDGQLSPGVIDKSLDLPMDAVELANQASRLLEDHDFTEVLNKIPDEAFRELFSDGKNGGMLPSREEAEELERALEAVDKDVKSLVKMSSTSDDLHGDLHDSILHGSDHNLNATLDTSLSELTAGGMGLDAITGSLTSSDLSNLSHVLSTMAGDGGPLSHIPMLSDMGFTHQVGGRLDNNDDLDELGAESPSGIHQWTTATTSTSTTNERSLHPNHHHHHNHLHHHHHHHNHQVCGNNGLINIQHNYGYSALLSPRFASQAPVLVSASKHDSKTSSGGGGNSGSGSSSSSSSSRHSYYNNLGSGITNTLENSLGGSLMPVTELIESSTEPVS